MTPYRPCFTSPIWQSWQSRSSSSWRLGSQVGRISQPRPPTAGGLPQKVQARAILLEIEAAAAAQGGSAVAEDMTDVAPPTACRL